jgi:acetylornithine/LysW-gamma-L-lysine aminotransferase
MTHYSELEEKYEFSFYPKRGITVVKGKNASLWDTEGNEFIDCIAGNGVASVGHCNDSVIEAILEQSKKLITCPVTFHNDARALLLERLLSVTPGNLSQAFLCNSGTESVEAAIKITRMSTKKTDFICAMRGFHGRTMGSLSAVFKKQFREGLGPFVPGFHFAPFNNFDKLKEKVTDKTAGILLEVVQGEGGIHVGDKEFFAKVRKLCTAEGIVLILDEVQSGFCRTGKMFACNHFDLEPDILCIAKAMAGGFPMGAVVVSDAVEPVGAKHGSTFGGNPLACAAANAAIKFMVDNKLDEQAAEKGNYITGILNKSDLSVVREIRGLGLMIGIELKIANKEYIAALMDRGVLVLPGGMNVIRLLPPLTIEYEQLDTVAESLIKVLSD